MSKGKWKLVREIKTQRTTISLYRQDRLYDVRIVQEIPTQAGGVRYKKLKVEHWELDGFIEALQELQNDIKEKRI